MEIDIRRNTGGKVDTIRFSDETEYRHATKLVTYETGCFYIEDEDDSNSVRLRGRENVENLIIALQKALDMDWA